MKHKQGEGAWRGGIKSSPAEDGRSFTFQGPEGRSGADPQGRGGKGRKE